MKQVREGIKRWICLIISVTLSMSSFTAAAAGNPDESKINPVLVTVTPAAGSMDLTELGTADWVHMMGEIGNDGRETDRKKVGDDNPNIIKVEKLNEDPTTCFHDCPVSYSWSDGTYEQSASGITHGAVYTYRNGEYEHQDITEDAGYRISVPAAETQRILTFVSGVWNAFAEIRIYANDEEEAVYTNDELNAGGNVVNKKYVVNIRSGNSLEVVCKLKKKTHGHGNLNLSAITLGNVATPAESKEGEFKEKLSQTLAEALAFDLTDMSGFFVTQLTAEINNAKELLAKEAGPAAYYEAYLYLETALEGVRESANERPYTYNTNPGLTASFGWEGDRHAPIAYIDGSYRLRDRDGYMVTFGVWSIPGKIKWYNKDGYLPCFVSEFEKDGMSYKIENFSDKVVINGNDYEIAYSRMTVTNHTQEEKSLPSVAFRLIPLNGEAKEKTKISAGETVVRDYAIGADRFSNNYSYPSDEEIASQGGFDSHYASMKEYWEKRLEPIAQITKLPDEKLINAYKAGYIYTLIIRDDIVQEDGGISKELNVGENGYDEIFDHDTIGIVAALLTIGDFTYAKDYLATLPPQLQYDDAKWKYSWPYALYLMKTGDIEFISERFDAIKTNTHTIETDRIDGGAGILKETFALDSTGSWLIDNWSALAGLTTYKYICETLFEDTKESVYQTEAEWAVSEYNSLLAVVEKAQADMRDEYNYEYLSIDMYRPTEESVRSDVRDANWASMFLFGRWAWDGYLFGADQEGSDMIRLIDDTYTHGFERRKEISDTIYNFGGYPHGFYSSAYNAGYGSTALRGEEYRDAGIKAYQFMINNAMSGPFGWWEGVDYPRSESMWDMDHASGGGGSCQHMWGQSTATKVLFDSLIAEKSDGTVIIGRGIPEEWITDGEEIELKSYPVKNGSMGYNLTTNGKKVTLSLTGDYDKTPVSLELIAFKGNIKSAGGLEFDKENGIISIPAGTQKVTVELIEYGDKTQLAGLYNNYKNIQKGSYTDESYQAFTIALNNAKVVLDNGDADKEAVDTAVKNLEAAYQALKIKEADKTQLTRLYNNYKNIQKGNYTDESYQAFTTALSNAKAFLDKSGVSQTEVDTAVKNLENAYKALKVKESTPTTISAPKNPKATAASVSKARITWGKVKNASGYELEYRAKAKGSFKKIKTTTSASYTHKNLKCGQTYYYRVRAYRNSGSGKIYSKYSKTVKVKIIPNTPGSMKVRLKNKKNALVSWKKVTGVNGYEIYRSFKKSSGYKKIAAVKSKSNTYIEKNLKKGKNYYYRVRAYKTVSGKKVYSNYSKTVRIKR